MNVGHNIARNSTAQFVLPRGDCIRCKQLGDALNVLIHERYELCYAVRERAGLGFRVKDQ